MGWGPLVQVWVPNRAWLAPGVRSAVRCNAWQRVQQKKGRGGGSLARGCLEYRGREKGAGLAGQGASVPSTGALVQKTGRERGKCSKALD